jgi:hypothetical protein
MDLKELESGVNPKTHWYYQSKKIPLIAFVKKVFSENKVPLTIIDVGSGSGFFMYELHQQIPEMISKIYLVDIGYTNDEVAETKNQIIEKITSLPDKIENGIVVMMDVLEHLEDDKAMLMVIKEKAKGENYFFITVPAFKNLWSGHDIFLGHYRRYTLETLGDLLQACSYKIDSLHYIFGFIFPIVWITRRLSNKTTNPKSDMKPLHPVLNRTLKTLSSAEMNLSKHNKYAGVSVLATGRFLAEPFDNHDSFGSFSSKEK